MSSLYPPYPAVVVRHPIRAALLPFPGVCFTLTLLTDLAFWRTGEIMWQNFSSWLLFAGLVFGGFAILVAIVEYAFSASARRRRHSWVRTGGFALALALAFVNSFVHAGDGWTAVVPLGLALSAVTVVVVIAAGWFGRETTAYPGTAAGSSYYD